MPSKKSSRIAGRFGARYGSSLRKKWSEIMEKRYADHTCPVCKTTGKVYRIASGVWSCKKCGSKWAGQAYTPS
ncbi:MULTISPECIES: 50S ribosomal protein L37ae [Metallosphaera]|uniref:Large ribosomal subunit protein eL43 n=3 Tax=Metallosphaera TaxID=41980 RepID=A4YCV4_METS5|nr:MULTISPECIES: 50S ribosomal protein L37ae [Metallosphaera]ABP94256.1 LSU ribosomal protein L37AE [Metallosphaera sedula DSM 5348]AIM26243.1 LSU ribosomal protein L37AE [Metallosphaera sedula]AKV73261.1 50S ribosomal protein L37 [Metallosphaera sedula]AKV75505.1 50S ribosomal protein L37 [Metallosphaera sedula]AKV77751.1 50S ribosomal protein L37 [Metallosphaera sedula]